MKTTLLLTFLFSITLVIGQPFINVNTDVIPVNNSSTAWGDYDNDGDMDLAICGYSVVGTTPQDITYLYNNDGNGSLTLVDSTTFHAVERGHLEWADFNQDNLLDLLVIGLRIDSAQSVSEIYQNLGNGDFSRMKNTNILPFSFGEAICDDFDNDGDIDVFISGQAFMTGVYSCMYFNNGNGTFSSDASFAGANNASMTSGDFDGDGDIDLIYSGQSGTTFNTRIAKYFKNNGNGTFVEDTNHVFQGVNAGCIAAADFDNDGDLDIIISGWEQVLDEKTRLYENNGEGVFHELSAPNLIGLINCDIVWGDYDVDGDMDILMVGSRNNNNQRNVRVYTNQGGGSFSQLTNPGLQEVFIGSCDWVDLDNDGDLDIFLTGRDNSNADSHSVLYYNLNSESNVRPTQPTDLGSVISGDELTMSWARATDSTTPQSTLSYNYYLKKLEVDYYQCPALSNIVNGDRKVVRLGNTSLDTTWTIKNIAPGNYTWSVQAIDNGYLGSTFAEEMSFTIEVPINYPELSVIVYPIPSYNSLTLKIQSPFSGDMKVTIFNVMGQKVLNTSYPIIQNIESKEEIQLPNMASGTYSMVINLNNQIIRRPLVILSGI